MISICLSFLHIGSSLAVSVRATLCSMRNEYRLCFWKGLPYPAIFWWCSSDLESQEKRLSLHHNKTGLWSPTSRQGSGLGVRVTEVRLLSTPETIFINPAHRPQWKDTQLLPNMAHFKTRKMRRVPQWLWISSQKSSNRLGHLKITKKSCGWWYIFSKSLVFCSMYFCV